MQIESPIKFCPPYKGITYSSSYIVHTLHTYMRKSLMKIVSMIVTMTVTKMVTIIITMMVTMIAMMMMRRSALPE